MLPNPCLPWFASYISFLRENKINNDDKERSLDTSGDLTKPVIKAPRAVDIQLRSVVKTPLDRQDCIEKVTFYNVFDQTYVSKDIVEYIKLCILKLVFSLSNLWGWVTCEFDDIIENDLAGYSSKVSITNECSILETSYDISK